MDKRSKVHTWKSPKALANAVVVVMSINLLVLLASIFVGLRFGASALYASGGTFSGPQGLRAFVDLARLLVFLACCVSLFWIVRASKNAHSFKPRMKISPLWAVGWYLVPVAYLFKPYEAMSEIWDASSTTFRKGVNPLLVSWWICFLLNGFIAPPLTFQRGTPVFVPLQVLSDFAAAVVTVLFASVVWRITAMQLVTHQAQVFGEAPQPSVGILQRLTD